MDGQYKGAMLLAASALFTIIAITVGFLVAVSQR